MSESSASLRTTDLTFFTNEAEASLYHRFVDTLSDVQYFDVLVGYFRFSGFHRLHEALNDVGQIRLLVGLSTGRTTGQLLDTHRRQQAMDFAAHADTRTQVTEDVIHQIAAANEQRDIEQGLRAFMRFLHEGKLQIRAYPAPLHAKVYIGRYHEADRDFGHVITGSSNFSESGLVGQREFNVELKQPHDVRYALQQFETLWEEGVEVTPDVADTMQQRTWLNDALTPYDIYLKFLYEYFEEDINLDHQSRDDGLYRPEGFMELEYQTQAVTAARKILEAHNGVFIADVVGLGKTYITAMLLQQIQGRTLVICPPVLQEQWREAFLDFGIRGCRVESLGKLEQVLHRDPDRYDTVVLDEAHRFRNEDTQRYEMLHEICFGKKVVCVSATPLNNAISDLYSLLKLFQTPRRSTIPGVPDLKRFFKQQTRALNQHLNESSEHEATAQQVSEAVRDRVLKHVMIRRTRSEIERYYEEDLDKQGVSFPSLAAPRRIIYAFDDELEQVFRRTIERLKDFAYARYTPLLYYTGELTPLQEQSQRNIGGFMKSIIVKRLESSFHAFKQTLARFIESYERFIEMYASGTVYLGKDVDVFDLLDNDRTDRLHALIEADRVSAYPAEAFTDGLMEAVQRDLQVLRLIQSDWEPVTHDPKLDAFREQLHSDDILSTGKLLVFTEAAETGEYLFEALNDVMPGQVLFYSSDGGRDADGTLGVNRARQRIAENFDPTASNPRDDYRLLITTDVLAEGINLHESNTVINYDLPWNPTRVLQRVGRINRVGTAHDNIYVYNFFPTDQADAQINLEANIKGKIQAFHDTLGEDAQYLTDEEEVSTHELFGAELYERLNTASTYEGEDEIASELEYLQLLRTVRDNDPERFARIQKLPKKARTAWNPSEGPYGLLTFFRRGALKQFFLGTPKAAHELTFFEAAEAFACVPDTPRTALPDDFYDCLERNRTAFEQAVARDTPQGATGGLSNEEKVVRRLKSSAMRRHQRFTKADRQYITDVIRAFQDGIIPRHTTTRLKNALEEEPDSLRALQIVRAHVSKRLLDAHRMKREARATERREVIVSAYRNEVEHRDAPPRST